MVMADRRTTSSRNVRFYCHPHTMNSKWTFLGSLLLLSFLLLPKTSGASAVSNFNQQHHSHRRTTVRQHPQQQPRWNYRNFLGDSSRGGSLQSTRSQPSAAASSSPGGGGGATSNIFRRTQPDEGRMPSLFVPEESVYDRYAACLAATEGLRRIRDRDLADEANVHGFGNDGERQINSQYVQNSERVLRALGMTVNQFNDLGRQITQDEKLRERVRMMN